MTPAELERELGRYASNSEVAEILEITTGRVTQLSDASRLPFITGPTGRLYLRKEILAIARKRRAKKAANV